ncbi:MAG: AAA family ATPase [Gammaproteobacteria bacterium]|nr:AAA family ATPase [Gammaproteobacteria bacterium]
MKRSLMTELKQWKKSNPHFPLLLRGARQVGKTYVVRDFAREQFKGLVEINFEKESRFKACFDTLDPKTIISSISLMKQQDVQLGETLLFLDEIQECPNAIMALRYFKEEMPDLHVIGAGSLLEFAINSESISMPVGRVQYIYLKPLSFLEFLQATGNQRYIEFIRNTTVKSTIAEVIHNDLMRLIREYMIIGGMPMVVDSYVKNKDLLTCQRYQTLILDTYRDDFAKYASKTKHVYLEKVFEKTPGLVGQQIKYSTIDPESRSRDIKSAIEKLNHAGIIFPCYSSLASGLPLNTYINERKFKLIFLDVGLVNRLTRLEIELLFKNDILLLNRGSIAEQFVGQELMAYQDCYEKAQVFYWSREQKSSNAEVDFLVNFGSQIVPIEVKSGSTGRLKSLHIFLDEKKYPLGVRVSEKPLNIHDNILSIPFYLISELERLIQQVK